MYDFLATQNIMGMVDELVDERQYTTQFPWLQRVPIVNAMDGEILGRYRGRIYAADIITLDGKARLQPSTPVRLTQTEVPVYKHGVGMGREQLRLINRIEQNLSTASERGAFANWLAEQMVLLIDGVYTRMEAVTVGMAIDGYSYNRLGVIMDGVTWGMPSDLKVTLAGNDRWSVAASATPVADILALKNTGRQKYGVIFDRLTMSTQAFTYMISTTEFQGVASGLFPNGYVMPSQSIERMIPIAQNALGIAEIEIDDRQFFTVDNAGTEGGSRFLPENKALLSIRAMDGNRGAWDFANAECEEAIPGMVPAMIGSFETREGGMYGPLGYVTAADAQGNPPGLNEWACASGFPRKHKESITAVLTVYTL